MIKQYPFPIRCNYNRHKSCTNPKDHSNTDCPLSPAVSYADLLAGDQLQGPLDDYDTYVAEQLLDISGSLLNPNAFFTVYQVSWYMTCTIIDRYYKCLPANYYC